MQGDGVGARSIEELEDWLESLDDDEWEEALDSLSDEEFEAFEARVLYSELKRRYVWDVVKLFFLVAYPIIWVGIYIFRDKLPASLLEWIPSSVNSLWTTLLQDVPAIGSIVVAVIMAALQFRNVWHFKDDVMPIAEEIKERKIAALE